MNIGLCNKLQHQFSSVTVGGLTSCCCDTGDQCHVDPSIALPNDTSPTGEPAAIVCHEGIGNVAERDTVCYGQCARITLQLSANFNTTVYGCDPKALCDRFGLSNSCGGIMPNGTDLGLFGCCCSTDQCNEPGLMITPPPTPPANKFAIRSAVLPLLMLVVITIASFL